jgi:transcriptional regulator with XRE-family HTH domain
MSSLFPEFLPASSRAAYERQVWGEFFGDLIRSAREERSLSVEEVSRAAGMAIAEWEAIEAGVVPRTREQLQAVAAALAVEWEAMASLALFCSQAWGR